MRTNATWTLAIVATLFIGLTLAAGCMTPMRLANPNDSAVNEPSYVEIQGPSLFSPAKYRSTKNIVAEAGFNSESKDFSVKINSDAATVNETIVKMQQELKEMFRDFPAQLKELNENHRIQTALLATLSNNLTQTIGMLTNLPGMIISGLTGKPFTPNAPPVLQQPAAAMDEATLRRIVREELNNALDARAGG